MKQVIVQKADVIERLAANRERHRRLYEAAMDRYAQAAVAQLDAWAQEFRTGGTPRVALDLPLPVDHTEDYDVALDMLGMAVGEVVDIDIETFRSYMRDDWPWRGRFQQTTDFYAVDLHE